jgi:DNA-binding CsgD family transcriptional regulator
MAFRSLLWWAAGATDDALTDAGRAAELARAAGDRDRELIANGHRTFLEFTSGGGVDLDAMRRAAAAEERLGEPVANGPTDVLAMTLSWLDELDEAREVAERLIERARARGDVSRAETLIALANVEWRLGDVARMEAHLTEALELTEQLGLGQSVGTVLASIALIRALRGEFDEAESMLEHVLTLAREHTDVFGEQRYWHVRLVLETTRRDWAAARECARRGLDLQRIANRADFDQLILHDKAAEAFLAAGMIDEADKLTREIEEAARAAPTVRRAVLAARTRALVQAARDDIPAALEALERALAELERFRSKFETGRTLLVAGSVFRRAKQRTRAREVLERAVVTFEECSSEPWAAHAREELARVSGRVGAGGDLTPTEQRVADLAAEGLATKEIASTLFVSPKTVEGHLTRIYEKLGVHSRAELARKLSSA